MTSRVANTGRDFSVKWLDFLLRENKFRHRTDEYHREELVVRRGQTFEVKVALNTEHFNLKINHISLFMQIDTPKGDPLCYKLQIFPSVDDVKSWAFEVTSERDGVVELKIMTPADAVLGKYQLKVLTGRKSEFEHVYQETKGIFVLFNSWCKDDLVYMADEDERKEYVLEDEGMIWKYQVDYSSTFSWEFGQFHPCVLDCALHLLYEKSELEDRLHLLGDPVLVTRALAALVNKAGFYDTGVLVGNWSGDYKDGVSPSVWVGSVQILEKYMEDKKPVMYGQCWVFSGVYTSLCRSLGIPTRSVTNFSSAHDTNGSCTIDVCFDMEGRRLHERNTDSIWNFHVWNECWFRRHDTPELYHGWQALDSTPQESSTGGHLKKTMVCGPAPVNAIREGDLTQGYDTPFVFAEVCGDEVYWLVDVKTGRRFPVKIVVDKIGQGVYTKAVGQSHAQDIVSSYKYEGEKGYQVMAKALSCGMGNKFSGDLSEVYAGTEQDVEFSFTPAGDVVLGRTAVFTFNLTNRSSSHRTLCLTTQVRAAFYNGVTNKTPLHEEECHVVLQPWSDGKAEVSLTPDEYIPCLSDCRSILKVNFGGKIEETCQHILLARDFVFQEPELKLECPEEVDQHVPFTITVSFENPLSFSVEGELNIAGGEIENKTIHLVGVSGVYTMQIEVTPKVGIMQRSKSKVHVSFTSEKLTTSSYKTIRVNRHSA